MPGKGTVTVLLATTYVPVVQDAGRGEGDMCYLFDYRKAFDSVLHRPLLDKLCQLGEDYPLGGKLPDNQTTKCGQA